MTEDQSILSQITDLKAKQAALVAQATEERADLIAQLAGLCSLLGPLTRDELPDGILKRRERTTKPTAPAKVRRPKAGVAA